VTIGYHQIADRVAAEHLEIFGGFHPGATDSDLAGFETLLLLGPHEPGFWAHVQASPEFAKPQRDPLDRWSARVIGDLATELGATALFPFGGPPYRPFIAWARKSGRAWASPVGLLVHDRAGLMVSYRGALALPWRLDLPPTPANPCESCANRPCLSACPVGALAESAYDLAACHDYLDAAPGQDCLNQGCAARRACPVSRRYGRKTAQSAFHMKAFHP